MAAKARGRAEMSFPADEWALILGGSSGFGLATARKLARHGMNVCVVHRDRRGAMARIEPEFDGAAPAGPAVLTINADALDADGAGCDPGALAEAMGDAGRVRVLLHSIAFGNLKLIVPRARHGRDTRAAGAGRRARHPAERLTAAVAALLAEGGDELSALAGPPVYQARAFMDDEDFARTIYRMGTSLLTWTQAVLARGLFAADARVFGLTSEGNAVAWKGYAAVAAAKVGARVGVARDGGRVRAARHPLEHRSGGRHRHARAARDPGRRTCSRRRRGCATRSAG